MAVGAKLGDGMPTQEDAEIVGASVEASRTEHAIAFLRSGHFLPESVR